MFHYEETSGWLIVMGHTAGVLHGSPDIMVWRRILKGDLEKVQKSLHLVEDMGRRSLEGIGPKEQEIKSGP